MKYAGIIKNDVSAGPGVCVTFFVQGCPIHCPGCHNQETWDFEGGKEFTPDTILEIIDALNANGVQRNFCIMGGEPMCKENLFLTYMVLDTVRQKYPNIKIGIWTGYEFEDIEKEFANSKVKGIVDKADYMVCGPFVLAERDITLPMVGSRNQYVINLTEYRNKS